MASGIESVIGERVRRLRALRLRPHPRQKHVESKPKASHPMKIILVCAWCRSEIIQLVTSSEPHSKGQSETPGKGCSLEEIVFDGICADCREKHFPETLRTVQENARDLLAQFRREN